MVTNNTHQETTHDEVYKEVSRPKLCYYHTIGYVVCLWCLCVYRRFNMIDEDDVVEAEQLELFPEETKPVIKVLYEDDGYHD